MTDGLTAGGTRSFVRTFCPRDGSLAHELCRNIDDAMAQAVNHRRNYVTNLEVSLRVLIDSLFRLSCLVGDLGDEQPPQVGMSPTTAALYVLHPLPLHKDDKTPDVFMTQMVVSACLMACTEAASIAFAPLYWFLCVYAAEAIYVPPLIDETETGDSQGTAPYCRLSSAQDHRAVVAKCDEALHIVNVARTCLRRHPDVRQPTLATMDGTIRSPVSPFLRYAGAITEALASVAVAVRAFAEFGKSKIVSVGRTDKKSKYRVRVMEFEGLRSLVSILRTEAERELPAALHADTDRRLRVVSSDIKLAYNVSVLLWGFEFNNSTHYNQAVDSLEALKESPRATAFLRLLRRFETPKETSARLKIRPILITIPSSTAVEEDGESLPFEPGHTGTEQHGDGHFLNGLVSYEHATM